jgi:Arm DNA-binding domain
VAEKLTKRLVERLIVQADPGRDTLVWDGAVPGLVLRLRSGSARFAFQYKRRGRTRRVAIGVYGPLTLDQARDQARNLYVQIRAGSDPAEDRRADRGVCVQQAAIRPTASSPSRRRSTESGSRSPS